MVNRVTFVLVLVLVLVLALATVSGYASATPLRVGSETQTCLKVSGGLLSSLKSGLKAKARGKLGPPRAVKSRTKITKGPRGFLAGTYFVSARVRGFGIATWAVDAGAFKTGGGFITVVGPVSRRVSTAGIDIPVSALRSWGLGEGTHGYAQSRRCVQ